MMKSTDNTVLLCRQAMLERRKRRNDRILVTNTQLRPTFPIFILFRPSIRKTCTFE